MPPFKLLALVTLLIDTVYTLFTIQTVLHCLNIACMPINIVGKVRTLLEWLLSKTLVDGTMGYDY